MFSCMRRYFFSFALSRYRTLARRADTILMNLTHLNLQLSLKRGQSQMNLVMELMIVFMLSQDLRLRRLMISSRSGLLKTETLTQPQ